MRKMTSEEFFELLYKIKDKPGMYLGEPSLTKLHCFMQGMFSYMDLMEDKAEYPNFLKGFQEWIQIKYDIHSTHHWSSIIRFYSFSESSALDLFYEELEQFMGLPEHIREYQNLLKLSERWMECKSEYWNKYHKLRDECMRFEGLE
jgi:hypothetical protein